MPETKLRYETETWGHVWKRHKNGSIYNLEIGGDHSGPVCNDCGYSFCDMCDEMPDERCLVNDTKNEAINNLFTELGI